jgi:hypothetical protein
MLDSRVRRWNQLAVATYFRLRRGQSSPLDRSAIRSVGSRRRPRRRRFGLKPPSKFDVPPDHVLRSRHRRLEGALITKVSQRCHPPAASLVSVTTIAPWGTRSSLRRRRLCAAEEVGNTDVSEVIEEKTKAEWRLHSSEKLANGRTRLTFRRPVVR